LTKAHQEFMAGPADSESFRSITIKGEFTLVIGPSSPAADTRGEVSDQDVAEAFRSLDPSLAGSGRRAAASEVAKRLGLTVNEVYRALERVKV
jgi:16S rRNA C1402 (ribose-2'-O) methylase RsmI